MLCINRTYILYIRVGDTCILSSTQIRHREEEEKRITQTY